MQALRELAKNSSNAVPSEKAIDAIASSGIADLDKSAAAYHEAQRKAEETRAEIEAIEAKVAQLRKELEVLESQSEALEATEAKFASVTPLGDEARLRILVSFVYEIEMAIKDAKRAVKGEGYSNQSLAFLEKFVLPALEGKLATEWSKDKVVKDNDVFVTQRFVPGIGTDWASVWKNTKQDLTPEQLHSLVTGICESEACDVDELKSLIAQFRDKVK